MEENNPVTKIQLTLSAEGLTTNSDPICRTCIFDPKSSRFTNYTQTEPSSDKINPKWDTKIELIYIFESKQAIQFIIEDSQKIPIGHFTTTLGKILSEFELIGNLEGFCSNSLIKISAKELKKSYEKVTLHLRAHNVDKMDFFGKSDPYFILSKKCNISWVQTYKSEIIKKTLDPIWKPFELTLSSICDNDTTLPLRLDCWDYDWGVTNDFIGFCEFTFQEMSFPNSRFQLINPSKLKKKPHKYHNSGILEVESLQIKKNHTFLDYIQAGTELNLILAIDFTISNGDYHEKSSLHHISPISRNDYEKAILSISNILEDYDSQKIYPVFGFGAEPQWSRRVEHCFPINKSNINPFIFGIDRVLSEYHEILTCVRLAGPTLLASVITKAMNITQDGPKDGLYFLLVILTDGEIQDVQQSKNALVESSYKPLSVAFVGIGIESFATMPEISSFPLVGENGRKSARNNTIFLPYKNYCGNSDLLTTTLLSKIPHHLLEYMDLINCEPELSEEHKTFN